MIELKNLSYEIEGKYILKDLNLAFAKNKITCITGHNGSGKSTLIKLLMGILPVSSGKILLNGKEIQDKSITERAKCGITIALQQPVRFKGLTVKDLLSLALKNETNAKEETTLADACHYLSMVGLCAKDYIDRQLDDTLSGGELKRIELAVAIAKGGEVLLFDEPEAGIDLWSFDSLVQIFKNLKDKTVIIVSHQKKVLENADYILLLNDSENAVFGKKSEVYKELQKPKCGKLGGIINE